MKPAPDMAESSALSAKESMKTALLENCPPSILEW